MALEEYKRKRDFKKTPEPGPGRIRKSRGGLSFVIQKHDATRLHYDFRLELDGVLLSWAVTRGPSYDPADKRLAVRTEDHPLAYGGFEGIIPEGEYGGGTVMLWDNGVWEPVGDPHEGLKKGDLKFVLKGQRLQGRWVLVRMRTQEKRENWLLIKEKDERVMRGEKAAKFLDKHAFSVTTGRRMEEIAKGDDVWHSKPKAGVKPVKDGPKSKVAKRGAKTDAKTGKSDLKKLMAQYSDVQLATLVDHPPKGEKWLHEVKFDGYRLLGFVSGGQVALRTRNGNDWTPRFPRILRALEALDVEDAVIDMEAVVLDAEGRSGFGALQAALSEGGDADRIIAYAFDLLHVDGENVTKEKLTARKARLAEILNDAGDTLRYSDHVTGRGDEMIARSCGLGLEGIISKEADAPYRFGRQKSWLKSKCIQRQEFVILGSARAKSGNRSLGALYLGYHKDGRLTYAGKVGTGFTMKSAADIARRLKGLATDKAALGAGAMANVPKYEIRAIEWVRPELLCEVAFTEWTEDGHVRHPSFQGLREDKKAAEVKMEKPVPVEKTAKAVEKRESGKSKKPAGENDDGGELVLNGIGITHPERVISETGHVTKGQLAEYYALVAPYMLESIARRPLSLLRCPGGIGKDCFYQRNPGRGLGPDVQPYHFKHKGKNYEYLFIADAKGLMEIVQMGAIEIHPWGAGVDDIDHPDRMIFDLDPAPDVPFEAVKLGALDLKARFQKLGLKSFLKCTGGKGLHVTVPLDGKSSWPQVKSFAEALADKMVAEVPDAYVATMTKAKRNGKIFIDFFRNDYTATAVADFSVRARDGAPVAMPLEWKELEGLEAGNAFTIESAIARLKKKKPDLKRYALKQALPESV
jgi:bifunctional non-homologous end joining protein LigD